MIIYCLALNLSIICNIKNLYKGPGVKHSALFKDVNECQNEAVCAINAKCTNTKGSFRCMCHIGYHGNAYKACQGKIVSA